MELMIIYLIVMSLGSIFVNKNHILSILLSLEFMVLTMILFVCYYLSFYMNESYLMMVMLCLSVCESVLGLSIIVLMVRLFGNDYLNSFNLLC
uniref:NADH-ubiquinone oxidoreductase chain 4L n=1 Tax=Cucujoidea sp. 22 KM-2017 TaxID=2219359 RepID=A0A346RI90_9CUCU|nr:NADH dehydrogenase subunit 4L [Cucujoidea sp. 22 KM-2017]